MFRKYNSWKIYWSLCFIGSTRSFVSYEFGGDGPGQLVTQLYEQQRWGKSGTVRRIIITYQSKDVFNAPVITQSWEKRNDTEPENSEGHTSRPTVQRKPRNLWTFTQNLLQCRNDTIERYNDITPEYLDRANAFINTANDYIRAKKPDTYNYPDFPVIPFFTIREDSPPKDKEDEDQQMGEPDDGAGDTKHV